MSFNLNRSTTFINVKLTDAGRRKLSLGQLSFKKAVLSDREINYGIDRTAFYDIVNNRVLAPADYHPDMNPFNLDGSTAITLQPENVVSAKQFYTADTPSTGFFSGAPDSWTIEASKYKGKGSIVYGSNTAGFVPTNEITISGYSPEVGDLMFVPWVPPQYGSTYMSASNAIPSGTPANALWYRILSGTTNPYALDRPLPRYAAGVTVGAFFYPYNGIESYYGSATTQDVKMWNMNIVRTESMAGTDDTQTDISGYTRYGSIQFNGTKHYFGFREETPAVGFIHYTNEFTGNTYGEQLIEESIQMFIPMIMWHKTAANNGAATRWGVSLFDSYGDTIYDSVSQTTYRELRDGIASTSTVVGRVYHRLKMIVITDQELLTVLSYKSDRNYTLPAPSVNLTTQPKAPLTVSQATGLCRKGYTYFVSYVTESDSYNSTDSFGHPDGAHCGYIQKIDGAVDINGNPQFLQVTFPSNSFPYMRSGDLSTSGHGWNSQYVQLLVSEQLTTDGYDVGSVPPRSWKRISTKASGGNGIYRASDDGDATIDPLKLNGHTFVVSVQDYNSGTTYTIASGLTANQNTLNFGNESFFHGVIDLQIFATNYKSIITVLATNNLVNSSSNDTFDSAEDDNTYITEVAILDETDQVVAVGKPTYPVKKSSGRYLAFQLEIDF